MNKKAHILLAIVLAINTLRYGSYLLEGDTHIYYSIMFLANLIAALFVVFRWNRVKTETGNSVGVSQ